MNMKIITEIQKIDTNSKVVMVVHGIQNTYKPVQCADDSWDLQCLDDNIHNNAWYGLCCESIEELKECLVADFQEGILSYIRIK